MAVLIGQASIDERGKASGGIAGNQKNELNIRSYYKSSWQYVLRPKNAIKAEAMAKACEQACNNRAIGYDQSQRNTLRTQAVLNKWDLSKIAIPCETDCSALMTVCAECAGISIPYNGNNAPATSNMLKAFSSTGEFEVITDPKYLNSDTYLKRGDILLKSGHTVMVLSNGSQSSVKAPTGAINTGYIVGQTYTLDANMYVRNNPNGDKLKYDALTLNAKQNAYFDEYGCGILKKGTRVTCKAVKTVEDSTWLQIPSGWVCGKTKDKVYIKCMI